jgi:hypothetical protein
MKPKAIYSLIVRLVGLLGMWYIIRHWAYYWHRHHTLWYSHRWEMIFEAVLMLFGLYMAIGLPILFDFIAPKDSDDKDEGDSFRR